MNKFEGLPMSKQNKLLEELWAVKTMEGKEEENFSVQRSVLIGRV